MRKEKQVSFGVGQFNEMKEKYKRKRSGPKDMENQGVTPKRMLGQIREHR